MNITVEELKERLDKSEKLNLIDVREIYEHEEVNIGGELIPLGTIPTSVEDLWDKKDEEIIVYCRSGNRSGQAQQFLLQSGFTNVLNLTGGMLAWVDKYGKGL
ncbi:UNVERIFIED_CONTAM: hypothetical protein GTU68_063035 [Idotea baltica]|nr:hypothetical protein [Idotea baltica]